MQFGFRPRSCRADCHQALLVANHIHRPLPIGHGQTISQPFIVALMTDMLQVESDNVVLEIGTGSGCQAARLAHLVREVDTIEIIPAYAETAAATLRELAYNNVKILCRRWLFRGSGSRAVRRHHGHGCGQPSVAAAYRAAKAGCAEIIPVGSSFPLQYLMIVEKGAEGRVTTRQTLPVSFVPLTRAD